MVLLLNFVFFEIICVQKFGEVNFERRPLLFVDLFFSFI